MNAIDKWPAAMGSGLICGVAGRSQREMRQWLDAYPGLYSARPFDEALPSTLAMCMAFSGPWFSAAQLRMANKVCLWAFGLDWLVDYVATSPAEVADIARRCLAVAGDGAAVPGDDLTRFLADIRRELATAPVFATLGPVWYEELRNMLEAMHREREWRASGVLPSITEYLGNADNAGFTFVFTSHLIHTLDSIPGAEIPRVLEATSAVQRVLRLLNDFGSYDRDREWGDLNALLLGVSREEVHRHLAESADLSRTLLDTLRGRHPQVAGYLERQMDFCAGFYQIADYWGTA